MKPLSVTMFVIAGFAGGLFFGQRGGESQDPNAANKTNACQPAPSACADMEKLKSELNGISPDDIRAYLKSQDADQKLRKADEILGKIMQLLVAQVGYRLQNEDLQQFGKIPEAQSRDTQPPPTPARAEVPQAPETPTTQPPVKRSQLTVRVNGVQTEEQARISLQALGSNFAQRHQQATALTAEQAMNLNGNFEGAIVLDRDQSVQRANLNMVSEFRNNRLRGSWTIEVFSANNQSNQRSNGSGDLTKSFVGNSNEVFIEVGRRYMLQLVFFPAMDQWIGNYLDIERGQYRKIGTVVFRRR